MTKMKIDPEYDHVVALVNALTKPMFVYRMNSAQVRADDDHRSAPAKLKAEKALQEIRDAVLDQTGRSLR
jgi:hypothetical protein